MRGPALIATLLLLAGCGPRQDEVIVPPADAPPGRLSAWNILQADGRRLRLNADSIPYDLNVPLFSDYALKLRTVWMPDGAAAGYRETGALEFPVGTILSKTFHYRRAGDGFQKLDAEVALEPDGALDLAVHRIVETRLLVRYDDGWKAFPYVWNDEQTDADLAIAGDQFRFRFGDQPFDYLVPDMNQCAACHAPNHTTKALQPLGPKAHQLNRDFSYTDGDQNQLGYWTASGRLNGLGDTSPASPRWTQRADSDLGAVARAYLDINCAHCHNPAGPADTSALDLSLAAAVDRRFGICKPPVAVGRGSGDRPYDIVPGRADESILLFRMQHDDPAIMMPELGRAMAHDEGVALIRAWISSLPGDC
jgi:uncharacterized repeat protein (TIGR03806 family)